MQSSYSITELNTWLAQDNFFIVIDEQVDQLYPQLIKHSQRVVKVCATEQLKSITSYQNIINELLTLGITRNSHLVAIGGGTVSDVVGFVAATLFRGVQWSVIPTTLLSMVDASIGGKTGINLDQGKNLIGAFCFPEKNLLSFEFLKSLELSELQSGYGEIIKYCFINTELMQQYCHLSHENLIIKCQVIKQTIVANDPLESGARRVLNLGHTWGHALEKTFGMDHGIAVILGLKMLFLLQKNNENLLLLEKLLVTFSIKIPSIPLSRKHQEILNFLKVDKKNKSKLITFVSADSSTQEYSLRELEMFLDSLGASFEL